MRSCLFAAIATSALTTSPSPDRLWHYRNEERVEVLRVDARGIVMLRYCDGRLRRIGKLSRPFVPWDARRLSPIVFDRKVGGAERSLAERIVADVGKMRSDSPWRLECLS